MVEPERVQVTVDGRRLSVSNLEKVLYPLVGLPRPQVIDYYVRVAPVMLPHIEDRGITLRRWPDGVTAESFFEKRCPSHRPGLGGYLRRSWRPSRRHRLLPVGLSRGAGLDSEPCRA